MNESKPHVVFHLKTKLNIPHPYNYLVCFKRFSLELKCFFLSACDSALGQFVTALNYKRGDNELNRFNDHRNTLTTTYTERHHTVFTPNTMQLIDKLS